MTTRTRRPARPKDPRIGATMVRIPKELRDAVETLARQQDRTIAWMVRTAIREYLARSS